MSNALILKPLPLGTVTASASAAGYDPAYVANDNMGVVWKSPAGGASRSLTLDLGADVLLDTALLLGCTGAAPGWTLQVEAATAALGPGFPGGSFVGAVLPFLAGATMPVNGRGKALWQAPAVSPPPASRYWRFTIGGLSSAAATVARIVIGRKIVLDRNFQFGAAFGVRDFGSADFSPRGVLLRRRSVKRRSIGLSFGNVQRDEVEAIVNPLLEELGVTDPVALITDPAADAQRQNRIWFGPMLGDLGTVWASAAGFEWRCNVVDLGG